MSSVEGSLVKRCDSLGMIESHRWSHLQGGDGNHICCWIVLSGGNRVMSQLRAFELKG